MVVGKSKPDGAPRKLLDVSRTRQLGWLAGPLLIHYLSASA
jgi:hypothetical protein